MQPTWLPRSARSAAGAGPPLTTSLIPSLPPGFSTRAHLGEHGRLVGREVDDAVRDDDVDRVGRQRDLLDQPLQEIGRSSRRPPRVLLCQREHLVRHVEAVRHTRWPDSLRRQEDVDASARTKVEHDLTLA